MGMSQNEGSIPGCLSTGYDSWVWFTVWFVGMICGSDSRTLIECFPTYFMYGYLPAHNPKMIHMLVIIPCMERFGAGMLLWRYVKVAKDHRIWPTRVNLFVRSIKTAEATAIPNTPKRNVHSRDFWGYDSGVWFGVWFGGMIRPTRTSGLYKNLGPSKRDTAVCIHPSTFWSVIFIYSTSQPSAVNAMPATQKQGRCHQVRRLLRHLGPGCLQVPRRHAKEKRHACHAKERSMHAGVTKCHTCYAKTADPTVGPALGLRAHGPTVRAYGPTGPRAWGHPGVNGQQPIHSPIHSHPFPCLKAPL